jgi:hypothetical protein
MTLEEFTATLASGHPPEAASPALRALWEDARGHWDNAHRIAQDIAGENGAWVHAYLHRKEGDAANAAYWYRRARKSTATDSLADEWLRIVRALL